MRLALEEAARAADHDDVPIGCVIVRRGEVLAAARNERELRKDPTAHAEVLALRGAARATRSWRLDGATAYVTLEPCAMCGPQDPKAGAALSLYNIVQDPRLNHQMEVTPDVLGEESAALLGKFFSERRPSP